LFTDAVAGFRYGALLGIGLILIGVLRFILVSASHDVTAPKRQELELLTYYVATFAVAGSIAGAVLPRIRSKVSVCVLGAVLGPVVVTGLVWSFDHYVFSSRFEWLAMAVPSAAVGAAIALYLWGERVEIAERPD
jgi:peptidoglycan/LPS O-acetylase OafA/YrhL